MFVGGSGATLGLAVYKRGHPEVLEEALYAGEILGPAICPVVYSATGGGYFMEYLRPAPPSPTLLRAAEELLTEQVWCRPPIRNDGEDWRGLFRRRFAVAVPDWLETPPGLAHGDPTASNMLLNEKWELRIGDPVAPRSYLPMSPDLDRGKLLQSFLGWEAAVYGTHREPMLPPLFAEDLVVLRRAAFWCLVHSLRIMRRETRRAGGPRQQVARWCAMVARVCREVEVAA
jgi:hypothetical protein